jgi:hypothetical protein
VNRAFSRERASLTRSSDRGLGVCILAHSMKNLWRVHLLWILGRGVGGTRNGCSSEPLQWIRT